jgi:hypothetical protein
MLSNKVLFDLCDKIPVLWRMVNVKTLEMFDRQLWSYSLEFFRGEISDGEFEQLFIDAIENQLTRAWNEGADEVGVSVEDMTEEDLGILQGLITDEIGYLTGLGVDIIDAKESTVGMTDSEALDAFRTSFRSRIDVWASKYGEMVNRAKIHFGGKTRLVWRLGATEEHCTTCSALNGIVAYAYEWDQSGITPGESGSEILECRGYHCDCSLEETDERRSPNAFQRLLDIATSGNV